MTQKELTIRNLGQSLDDLMNLDPRGYGVCKILYDASRRYTGEPLTANAAKKLKAALIPGDYVFIITGFVLRPFASAETDGIIGSILLARSLVKAFAVKPVIVCQEENIPAVKGLSRLVGLHFFDSVEKMGDIPASLAYYAFTKDSIKADGEAEALLRSCMPKAVITVEAPGANEKGYYHNAIGQDITPLEAKMDVLFDKLIKAGVLNLSIGDLGNEIGMGTIGESLRRYIPYAGEGECACGCGGGLAVRTSADNIITATTSDWGCYGLCAMIAFLCGDLDIFHDAALQAEAMQRAADCGMIDMYGWTIPAIDGIGKELNCSIVTSMRECVRYSMCLEKTCAKWFEKTIEKGYFEKKEST